MAETTYVPDPRGGNLTVASREFDCTCGGSGGNFIGTGSPEGVVTADPGDLYSDESTNSIWIKETGTGTNTGWVQYVA